VRQTLEEKNERIERIKQNTKNIEQEAIVFRHEIELIHQEKERLRVENVKPKDLFLLKYNLEKIASKVFKTEQNLSWQMIENLKISLYFENSINWLVIFLQLLFKHSFVLFIFLLLF